MIASTSKNRLEWVDSLRGIASLLVVVLHLWLSLGTDLKIDNKFVSFIVFGYTDFGKIGVVAFFIISGFVIPYSFRGKTNEIFFINRFFRLYPAYWVAILSLIIISGLPPLKELIINFTMFQRFVGVKDLIGAFWTLQIELIFYFICAGLNYYKLLENDRVIMWMVVLFILLSFVTAIARNMLDMKLPVALFLALSVMFIGLAWRKYSLDKSIIITKQRFGYLLGGFILILLPITLLAYSKNYGNNETWYRYFFSYLIAIGLFFVFAYYKFVNPVLLNLGKISYSLYLLHAVFGLDLTKIVMLNFGISNVYFYIIFFFTSSFVSAYLCYKFIELPSVKLGKNIVSKFNQHRK